MNKQYPSPGDKGRSKLASGKWAQKDHSAFEAVGTLDELNSIIGWVRCSCDDPELDQWLMDIQKTLFELGAVVSRWSLKDFSSDPVSKLENQLRSFQKELPDSGGFILPDGCELASRLHIARTVCRRAERCLVRLNTTNDYVVSENVLRFINRLSDWLYTSACRANYRAGEKETVWNKQLPGNQDVEDQK